MLPGKESSTELLGFMPQLPVTSKAVKKSTAFKTTKRRLCVTKCYAHCMSGCCAVLSDTACGKKNRGVHVCNVTGRHHHISPVLVRGCNLRWRTMSCSGKLQLHCFSQHSQCNTCPHPCSTLLCGSRKFWCKYSLHSYGLPMVCMWRGNAHMQ